MTGNELVRAALDRSTMTPVVLALSGLSRSQLEHRAEVALYRSMAPAVAARRLRAEGRLP